nr:metallophosphoesterase [uncultured Mediterraneibacter sp.]
MNYAEIGVMIIAILLLGAVIFEIYRELHSFCVTEYEVTSSGLKGADTQINVVFLSDLHSRSYGKENCRLLRAVQKAQPDLILIGGDMLIGKGSADHAATADFVSRLPAIAPVYYALGNHEARLKDDPEHYGNTYQNYKKKLEEAGVTFLENDTVSIICKKQKLLLSGLELPITTYKKFRKSSVTARTLENCLTKPRGTVSDYYEILMAHNPAYMDAYLDWGADLILSGHLHGGLVRMPGIGGIVTPQGFFFPKYSGEMTRKGNQTVIVSRGLGTHTINIRLFNMPELIVIHLKKSL